MGLSVTGELEEGVAPLALDGLAAGDALVLTKPLGTGVVLAADMQGRAPGRWVQAAYQSMLRATRDAAHVARAHGASASTDVSGFGLAGHLAEMLRASGAAAVLHADALPLLPGAAALLEAGVRSTFHEQNAGAARGTGAALPAGGLRSPRPREGSSSASPPTARPGRWPRSTKRATPGRPSSGRSWTGRPGRSGSA